MATLPAVPLPRPRPTGALNIVPTEANMMSKLIDALRYHRHNITLVVALHSRCLAFVSKLGRWACCLVNSSYAANFGIGTVARGQEPKTTATVLAPGSSYCYAMAPRVLLSTLQRIVYEEL